MYKLLALGAMVGIGLGIAKFIKSKKEDSKETVQTQEQQPAAA